LKPGKARVMSSNAQWTRSSAVEHYVDIVGVTGSIPVVSTIKINGLARSGEIYANEKANETLRLGCIARRWVLRVWER
jgi:hypothetical protein